MNLSQRTEEYQSIGMVNH